jgi:glucuronokinase
MKSSTISLDFSNIETEEMSVKKVSNRCYARVGLIGNPSDGFHGKTISLTIANFSAEVTMEAHPLTDNNPNRIVFIPHPVYDKTEFASLDDHLRQTTIEVHNNLKYLLVHSILTL